ncbi:hypothetical protein D050_1652B, partial [Vibrio parahaemolyticus VPCR-2009]
LSGSTSSARISK